MQRRGNNTKGNGITIPGVILDQIKSSERYEADDRFSLNDNSKGKKRGLSTLGRKDRRKQERSQKKQKVLPSKSKQSQNKQANTNTKTSAKKPSSINLSAKKSQNKPKKTVTWSEKNQVKDITDSEPSSSDESDGGIGEERTWAALAKLKGIKDLSPTNDIRIVKEDELDDELTSDDFGEEPSDDGDSIDGFDEDNDEDEDATWAALKALKGYKKSSNDQIRIVKEDDLEDEYVEEEGNSSDDEGKDNDKEDKTWAALKALKGKKSSKNTDIRIVKEDELEDDSFSSESDYSAEPVTEEDTWAALKALKGKTSTKQKSSKVRIVREEDLEEDDSFSDESDEEVVEKPKKSESSKLKSKEVEYAKAPLTLEERELLRRDEEDIDYYAKKLGIKKNKKLSKQGDDDLIGGLLEGLDFGFENESFDEQTEEEELKKKEKNDKKENKNKKKKDLEDNSDDERIVPLTPHEREQFKRDDDDIDYYAKKLGLKKGQKLTKEGDDDILGGLLDGLDFDGGSKYEYESEDELESEDENPKNRHQEKMFDSDDDINSSDFDSNDDDLDEDDKELLRQMGEYGSDSEDGSDYSSEDEGKPRVKENPYVAPGSELTNDSSSTVAGTKYIPPALRRKIALENSGSEDNEKLLKIVKLTKGPLNRLSEPTLITVVNELNALYNDNARQLVNEAIVKSILESVLSPIAALESLLVLYSGLIVSLFRLQGVAFGAYVLQTIVEKLNGYFADHSTVKGKEVANLIALLGYCYNLNLVGSKLIYDIIINKLLKDITEFNTDILLRLIRACGTKMRSDDPSSLKQIILDLNKSIADKEKSSGAKSSPRTKFLIETITNLKNNKLKNMENENTLQMFTRIRKQIGRINATSSSDPIKVTLDDIESVEERGKWWLVGSAWKGQENTSNITESENANEDPFEVNKEGMNDILDSSEPNWIELARQQRMNTDIRRAVFISIMSAEDYMDAMGKFEKLQLKRNQEREIPNILMHCTAMESLYNPYYGFLAKKLCEEHSMRKTFQFNLWDFVKDLEGEGKDDDDLDLDLSTSGLDETDKLKKILNLGRLFGFLIGEGSLPLNILRTINFLTATSDTKLFVEILLITFFDSVSKLSEEKSFGSGLQSKMKAKDLRFNDKVMIERVAKCKEQKVLLHGLQFFLQDKLKASDLIKGKKQKARVSWGVDAMCDVIDTVLESQSHMD